MEAYAMTRYYSSSEASAIATELGHPICDRELRRQAKLGRLGTKHGPVYRFTHAQIVKFLEVTRRKNGRQYKPTPTSVTVELDPESDEAKELLALLEEMTNDAT